MARTGVPVIAYRTSEFMKDAADELLNHFAAQEAMGQPIYVALSKPQTLELRGGKQPVPGAVPYDVSSEGVPMYKMLELGWNPETQQRETSHPENIQGAPEQRGVYAEAPARRRGEVHKYDAALGQAFVSVPLNYPQGHDARLHPHSMSGWVPFNDVKAIIPPRSPFRRKK